MELDPKNHNEDGLLGPNSIMVVYMDPLGKLTSSLLAPRVGKLRDDFVGVGGCLFVDLGFKFGLLKF